jgi:type VI secretion system secreted protein Hcp
LKISQNYWHYLLIENINNIYKNIYKFIFTNTNTVLTSLDVRNIPKKATLKTKRSNMMQTAMYMKIPGITGDATEKNHTQWIKITGMDVGVNRNISADPGHIANRESTRPAISKLTINKSLDSASSLLFGEACTGKAKQQIVIECCKTGDQGLTPVAQFTLENAIVSGYKVTTEAAPQQSGSDKDQVATSDNGGLVEEITISFDKIEMKTIPHGADGSAQTPISYGYDLKTAAAA